MRTAASTTMKTAATAMKTAAEAPLPAEGVVHGSSSMIEASEGTGSSVIRERIVVRERISIVEGVVIVE